MQNFTQDTFLLSCLLLLSFVKEGGSLVWNFKKKKKTLWPLFMDGVQLPQGYSHFEDTIYFLPFSSQKSWYSFYRPRKDERLSRPCRHPVVLNTGLLDWESSVLTTRPLLDDNTSLKDFKYSLFLL